MASFSCLADVQKWVDQDEHGVDQLRFAVSIGQFGAPETPNNKLARAWLEAHGREEQDRKDADAAALAGRATKASEASAEAARTSARAALIAIVVSLIALAVSIWGAK